jgi:hypothetical protein
MDNLLRMGQQFTERIAKSKQIIQKDEDEIRMQACPLFDAV